MKSYWKLMLSVKSVAINFSLKRSLTGVLYRPTNTLYNFSKSKVSVLGHVLHARDGIVL